MRTKWNEMSVVEKVMTVIKIVLSVIVIVLVYLQNSGAIYGAINYALPLLGFYMFISIFQEWEENRDLASLHILLAILIFIVTFVVWFSK